MYLLYLEQNWKQFSSDNSGLLAKLYLSPAKPMECNLQCEQ